MGLYLIAESQSLASILGTTWVVLQAAIGLGFVIFVHELGHFVVAKVCGVKCEKFYVGFDIPIGIGPLRLPRTLGKFTWGETEYGIGIVPLGGYVKMLGQDDNPVNAKKEAERIKTPFDGELPSMGDVVNPLEPIASGLKDLNRSQATPDANGGAHLDPRSYPAQPVLARMCIISAGVIMNVISGGVFAAIAYRSGVQIMPCELAGTLAGSPAWQKGLRPGDKLIQIGKEGQPDEFLRWRWELTQKVAYEGLKEEIAPLDLLIDRKNSDRQWFKITPSKRVRPGGMSIATLGVFGPRSTRLDSPPVEFDDHPDLAKFGAGDEIIGIDGELLPVDEPTQQIKFHELSSRMQARFDRPVTLTIKRRAETKEAEATEMLVLPARRLRHLGLIMRMGPVVAVRENSPAAQAGFQRGDVIAKLDGKPVGDPITLPQRVATMQQTGLVFTVERAVQNTVVQETVVVQLSTTDEPAFAAGDYQSLERVGIAYEVSTTVDQVRQGSPAAEKDIQPGDRVVQITMTALDENKQKDAEAKFGPSWNEPLSLENTGLNWTSVSALVQELTGGTRLQLTTQRAGEQRTIELSAIASETFWHTGSRGLKPRQFLRIHTAASWVEATLLGVREIKERGAQVAQFLGLLATGQLSPKQLGGPVAIAQIAGSEASRGVPSLLLFLTFLSVNLAILNFLPIPALDGGHMVFLSWEMITGKPPNERLQMMLTLVSVGALLALMLFVIGNDIHRMFF